MGRDPVLACFTLSLPSHLCHWSRLLSFWSNVVETEWVKEQCFVYRGPDQPGWMVKAYVLQHQAARMLSTNPSGHRWTRLVHTGIIRFSHSIPLTGQWTSVYTDRWLKRILIVHCRCIIYWYNYTTSWFYTCFYWRWVLYDDIKYTICWRCE